MLLDDTERYKFNIFSSARNRSDYENTFWEAERLESCNGDITYLFEVLKIEINNYNSLIDIENFNKIKEIIVNTLEKPNDLMRRSLLTFGNYFCWDGNTPSLTASRHSFGSDSKFYREIAQNKHGEDKKEILIKFLMELIGMELINKEAIEKKLESTISSHLDNWNITHKVVSSLDEAIIELIKDKKHWEYMKEKLFCITYDQNKIYTLKRKHVRNHDAYKILSTLKLNPTDSSTTISHQ